MESLIFVKSVPILKKSDYSASNRVSLTLIREKRERVRASAFKSHCFEHIRQEEYNLNSRHKNISVHPFPILTLYTNRRAEWNYVRIDNRSEFEGGSFRGRASIRKLAARAAIICARGALVMTLTSFPDTSNSLRALASRLMSIFQSPRSRIRDVDPASALRARLLPRRNRRCRQGKRDKCDIS